MNFFAVKRTFCGLQRLYATESNKKQTATWFICKDKHLPGKKEREMMETEEMRYNCNNSESLKWSLRHTLGHIILATAILTLCPLWETWGQTELITNGSFETLGLAWQVDTNGSNQEDSWWNIERPSGAYDGNRYQYLGAKQDGVSEANNVDGLLYQTITMPPDTTSAILSYYVKITTSETTTTEAFDHLYVEIQNTSGVVLDILKSYSNLSPATFSSWTQQSVNLGSSYSVR